MPDDVLRLSLDNSYQSDSVVCVIFAEYVDWENHLCDSIQITRDSEVVWSQISFHGKINLALLRLHKRMGLLYSQGEFIFLYDRVSVNK